MNLSERDYYLGFSVFPDIGPLRFKLLTDYFGSAKKAWSAEDSELFRVNLPGKIARDFVSFRNRFSIEKFKDELVKKKIDFLSSCDLDYPFLLKQIASVMAIFLNPLLYS